MELDIGTQTALLRMLVVLLCAWIAYEAWCINKVIATPRFNRLAKQIFLLFSLFTVGRLAAAILDTYLDLKIGWFSNIVNTVFYVYFGRVLHKQRITLEKSDVDANGRRRISVIVEEMFEELRIIDAKLELRLHNSQS